MGKKKERNILNKKAPNSRIKQNLILILPFSIKTKL